MSNELTDVRCPCGDEYPADSYDAGFIAGSGMCQNCDAALPPKDICTCPSGDGSLRHPCPAHPAVEQACWDERDFQAKGAQEVPSPVSKEYDRHLIGLLRKGEALPGHQEEAADEIERLRDWNDHLNNTVLPNILNPNFLMLMKGGERLLDLCTKDGKFIGVSLNDMKDVFDWMVTHARIAPDHAALAQPSPVLPPFAEKVLAKLRRFYDCAEDFESGGVDIGRHWLDLLTQLGLLNRVQRSPALWEISQQGEDLLGLDVSEIEVPDSMIEKAWQRFERALQQLETPEQAEQAEQAGQRELLRSVTAERDAALARVAEMERQEPVAWVEVIDRDYGPYNFHGKRLLPKGKHQLYAAPVAQAQHSVPKEFIGRLSEFLAQRGATGKALLRELRALCAAAPGKEGL
ncbi:TPA: hypothetical protein L3884_004735 [Pseudomonas aeruginosa]|nr:hypothetical protein [Pseudomonas aeruginosa]